MDTIFALRHSRIWIQSGEFCQNVNEFKSVNQLEEALKVRRFDWLYFTVVRDPIDRFFSGFVDKCLRDTRRLSAADRCFGCKEDVDCVIERLHKRSIAFSLGRTKGISFDDIHFFPQNWHCNMKQTYDSLKYVKFASPKRLEYREMVEKMLGFFRDQGVELEKLHFIRKSLNTGQTRHSTSNLDQRKEIEAKVRANSTLMRKLVQTFYFDMILFDFDIPNLDF
ncbi:unnamed protein product [Bursaphelenchus xylophilus]|uniref:(pine wood nematode) hypothetical protein n=1 Tax=Bursaphelenchus xylophilus TaxID=6326 RepID=A0A811M7A6_BURXY|nr:unnamed protein product [Bursaphelenchus xylophilus]CAG9132271.1 unnamed protein product [Bursaphelenchus xylophilus]